MDNLELFERHDAESEKWLNSKPICHKCGEHIQQESAVEYRGKYYCEECEDSAWAQIRHEFLEEI